MGAFIFPDTSRQDVNNQWAEHLHTDRARSVQYLQFKNNPFGSTPVQTLHNIGMVTPNTSHEQYSEIETTKRKMIESQHERQQRRVEIHHPMPRDTFRYPHNDFLRFAPDIRKFYRVPKVKMPSMRLF